jgi:hypothetical protein
MRVHGALRCFHNHSLNCVIARAALGTRTIHIQLRRIARAAAPVLGCVALRVHGARAGSRDLTGLRCAFGALGGGGGTVRVIVEVRCALHLLVMEPSCRCTRTMPARTGLHQYRSGRSLKQTFIQSNSRCLVDEARRAHGTCRITDGWLGPRERDAQCRHRGHVYHMQSGWQQDVLKEPRSPQAATKCHTEQQPTERYRRMRCAPFHGKSPRCCLLRGAYRSSGTDRSSSWYPPAYPRLPGS